MAQILILEHDKRQFQLVKRCVEANGHKIFWSAKPAEGLDLLGKYAFDLIICGVNLDEGDVFEFLRAVKNSQQMGAIPFVFCCADIERIERYATPVIKAGGKALGACKYILLPDFDAAAQLWDELQDCLPENSVKKDVLGGPIRTYSLSGFSRPSSKEKAS